MGVVVRRYIDFLIIIMTYPYSTCISSFFGSCIPTSLFIFLMFIRSCTYISNQELMSGRNVQLRGTIFGSE